ncbi:NAD-dependent epimerase/dehydratase family protein [Saccharicrinis sp. FJH54]|uniref:NAD-dependent epimerase/dehydratase family protein n=1 Tax=Saccharicrinis sp. FJH54 TaxID=3344665 RepID=UPI0035D4F3A7
MRIAITGSFGFIGKHLKNAIQLNFPDYSIIELDINNGYDLTNKDSLNSISDFDLLIHLAGKSFVPESFNMPHEYYYTNVVSTLNALELCRKKNARFIFFSSYVYGEPEYLPIDENHPLKAFNPYAQTKIIGEELCKGYHRDFNIPVLIFRPFNIYGPGQNENFLIPKIISEVKKGNTSVKLKDARPRRDFIYITDVIDAIIKACSTDFDYETLNIASEKSYSVKELTDIIKMVSENTSLQFIFDENTVRKNEVLETVGSNKKIKSVLNWEPKVSLKKGIELYLNS